MSLAKPNTDKSDARRLTPAVQRVIEWHRQRREAASAAAGAKSDPAFEAAPQAANDAQGRNA